MSEPTPTELVEVVDAELVDEDVHGGELVGYAGGPPTAAQVYEEWIKKYEAKSLNTSAAYERNFAEWCDWLSDQGLNDILGVHTRHVERWREHLERTDNPNTGRPLAPASIAQRIAAVSSYYQMARRLEAVQRNPAEDAERPDVDPESSDERELTEDETRRLISTAFGLVPLKQTQDVRRVAERDAEIVAFLVCTGVRVSECRNARVEDLGYKRGNRVLTLMRKGRKQGVVVLGACTEMVDRRVAGRERGPIWSTRSGKPVSRAWIYFAIQRIARAAAIPDPHTVGPHALRAAFAMLSLDYGASLYDVQIAMGHADPRTTARYDRRRHRVDDSPVHLTSRQLLDKNPEQKERLF